ncbi:MAG: WecB/TagA/CpsF family glycosyltransferase, partial [Acidobacteria bacterium]|nr:WecB/TagA/CpsF family glycosyltransferase [Acidobacteriota bacterium]
DLTRERIRVVSLAPDVLDEQKAIAKVDQLIRTGQGGYVCLATVHMVMESVDSEEFAAKVNGADMIVPDGMPIVWMQKFQGNRHAKRIRGNDLMIGLCSHAEKNGYKVGFYGGKQEVIDSILKRAEHDFPQLSIAYAYSPPFRPLTAGERERVIGEIRDADPHILFVGLGCPKQENWMAENRGRLRAVMLGIGASFDFFAGNLEESPPWVARLGLEWLFRLWQEPKRLWRRYIILNPRFIFRAGLQLAGLGKADK